jgi:hypothetical protein
MTSTTRGPVAPRCAPDLDASGAGRVMRPPRYGGGLPAAPSRTGQTGQDRYSTRTTARRTAPRCDRGCSPHQRHMAAEIRQIWWWAARIRVQQVARAWRAGERRGFSKHWMPKPRFPGYLSQRARLWGTPAGSANRMEPHRDQEIALGVRYEPDQLTSGGEMTLLERGRFWPGSAAGAP